MPKVCLDPGHNSSGADTGAVGNGLREQDINLDIALRIKPLLEYNGISVVMTRESEFVKGSHSTQLESLQTRVNIADNNNVDLFVSIHINAGGGTGTEVLIAGTGGRAEVVAKKVLNQINKISGWANRGVKVQNVHVLRETSMPAILTENGFIDHALDSAKLKDPSFLQKLAVAHAKGICDYFAITYKEQPQNVVVTPVVAVDKDIYLSVRCYESKADQAIKDINKLGFACKRLDLA